MANNDPLSPDTLTLSEMNARLAPHPDVIASAPAMLNLADFNARLAPPVTSPVASIVPTQASSDTGPGFWGGIVGEKGTGIANGIGQAVLPTAGAIIGSFGGPGGSYAGAAAGEATKEAIGSGIETYHDQPQSISVPNKVLNPLLAAGGQALGEKVLAPVGKLAYELAYERSNKTYDRECDGQ